MKKLCALLAMLFIFSACENSGAVDFNIKGIWNMGFGVADAYFTRDHRDSMGRTHKKKHRRPLRGQAARLFAA